MESLLVELPAKSPCGGFFLVGDDFSGFSEDGLGEGFGVFLGDGSREASPPGTVSMGDEDVDRLLDDLRGFES